MFKLSSILKTGVLCAALCGSASWACAQAQPPANPSPETPEARQARLIQALQSPELTAEKAAAFEELAAWGSPDVIPLLAPLLADEQLAHYARCALEPNPHPAVDELFRKSLDGLQGKLLIGVINSIGVRRDEQAIPALADKSVDADIAVAGAAAHALGCIGTQQAGDALLASIGSATTVPQRTQLARGVVLCAENLSAAGERERAVALYDLVRDADVLPEVRWAALRGAIVARGDDGLPVLLEHLRSDDPALVAVALRAARELEAGEIVPALIAALEELSPATQAGVLLAIGDLGDTQAEPVVADALGSAAPAVRIAALHSLKKIGTAKSVPALWEIAVGTDAPLAEFARETLAALRDQECNDLLVAKLSSTEPADRLLALELIGRRRITAAVPEVLELAENADETVKCAAWRALGETVALEQVPVLVQAVIGARNETEKAAAQVALTAACVRMPDRDACATMLTEQLKSAPDEAKTVLLEQLGAMGGPVALACLAGCAKDSQPDTQDAATRILGTWIGADVGPVLLDLARTIQNEKYKIRVLRGYIRIASQFGLPHDEKMDMCSKALAVAERDEERDLVLNVLAGDPSPIALGIAITQLDQPALKAKAASVAVAIAQTAIQDDPQAVADAMQKVIRAGVGGDVEARAQGYLKSARESQ